MSSEFTGDQVAITYDADVCIHAGNCVAALPAVFNLDNDPWITPDGATAEEVEAAIKLCPSGALGMRRTG